MKLAPALCIIAFSLSTADAFAQEVERNFAGSAQLDYLAVPSTVQECLDAFPNDQEAQIACLEALNQ